jgi:hypothetical protein
VRLRLGVVLAGIKRASTTEDPQLRDAIAYQGFPAVTGTITINEKRGAASPP